MSTDQSGLSERQESLLPPRAGKYLAAPHWHLLQAVDPAGNLGKTISLNCGVAHGTALGPSDQPLVRLFPTGAWIVDLAVGTKITNVSGTTAQGDEVTYNPSEKTYSMAGVYLDGGS